MRLVFLKIFQGKGARLRLNDSAYGRIARYKRALPPKVANSGEKFDLSPVAEVLGMTISMERRDPADSVKLTLLNER